MAELGRAGWLQAQGNSKFYSAKPPERLTGSHLPHVTIQMPVYMEPLTSVIMPTVESLEAAIRTYEWQGGSATIFICDDGLQVGLSACLHSCRLTRQPTRCAAACLHFCRLTQQPACCAAASCPCSTQASSATSLLCCVVRQRCCTAAGYQYCSVAPSWHVRGPSVSAKMSKQLRRKHAV